MRTIFLRSIGAALLGTSVLLGSPAPSHAAEAAPAVPLIQSVQYYYGPGPGYYGGPRFYGYRGYYGRGYYGRRWR